ncbi:MAG: hypothetical protein ACRD4E_03420 [Bryobacteraceae bacterium]
MENVSDTRQQLADFRAQLAQAEQEASRATRRLNYLRQVVEGLNGLLKADTPEATPSLFEINISDPRSNVARMLEITREELAPAPSPPGNGRVLRGRAAVRAVLAESRRAWKIPELAEEIQRRGWMPDVASPRDATAASVQRLVQDEEAERVGRGEYQLRLDKLPPPPDEEEP